MTDGQRQPQSYPWHHDPNAVFSHLYQTEVTDLHLRGQTDWEQAREHFQVAADQGLVDAIHLFWLWFTDSIVGRPAEKYSDAILAAPIQLQNTWNEPERYRGHTHHWELPALMLPIAYLNGQWTRQPEPFYTQNLQSEFAVAGPGAVPPQHLAQNDRLVHNYHLWANGSWDMHWRTFVWDSRKVHPHSHGAWCTWELLDQDLDWLRNPDPRGLPQKVAYHVTTGNQVGESAAHTVVFSLALHLAFRRSLLHFHTWLSHLPIARNHGARSPVVFH